VIGGGLRVLGDHAAEGFKMPSIKKSVVGR
jgi:hypothetical protein